MDPERVETARQRGRTLLVLASILIAAVGFGYIAAPAGSWLSSPLTAIGLFGMLVGLSLMWRIHRRPMKQGGAHWRFRSR